MQTFKNHFNTDQFPTDNEVNNLPSLTEPDQAMSISEIMRRFARGIPVEEGLAEVWDGEDNDLPDPRTLDLVDLEEMKHRTTEEIRNLADKYTTQENQKKAVKKQKEKAKKQEPEDLEEETETDPPDPKTNIR